MSMQRKRFKVRYAVLGILIVLAVAIAAFVGSHWDLLQAAKVGLTTDPATIAQEQEQKDRGIEEALGVEGLITDEMIAEAQAEIEQTLSGASEPAAETTGAVGEPSGTAQDTSAGEGGGGTGTGSSGTAPISTGDVKTDIVAKYTTKMYGVRGAIQGRLDSLISSAKEEYLALPEAQRTSSARNSILSAKLNEAEALEAECDAAVESLLGEMEAELKAAGESTDPVKQLRSYYKEAKINQKAAYLAQMR